MVFAGLSHREGLEESPHRRHRRAAHGLQHCALLERIFETSGITIETIDLSEIFGRINRMNDTDDAAQAKLAAIRKYVTTTGIPDAALLKMAKLGAVIDGWMKQSHINISAVQCWTDGRVLGVVPCTIMSMNVKRADSLGREVDVPACSALYDGAGLRHAFAAA